VITIPADPYHFAFDPATTALVVIDMQRDFVEPGGFGETLGNDVSLLQSVVPPLKKVLETASPACGSATRDRRAASSSAASTATTSSTSSRRCPVSW
jgi:isochorismate hydrolase